MLRTLILCLGLSILPTVANSQELTVNYGYVWSDSINVYQSGFVPKRVGIEDMDDISASLDFNYQRNETIGLFVSQQSAQMEGTPSRFEQGLTLQHVQFVGSKLYPQGNWTHRVSLGLGFTYLSPDEREFSSHTRLSGQLAVGTRFAVTPKVAIGVEARWLPIFMNNSGYIFCNGGCSVGFGSDNILNQFSVGAGVTFRF